jgi:uncharacterized membrane protein YkvI|tara:strand:+ start:2935 stop:4053 length:1119 start_codon:yes stop_codon:yes gene_type:complete
MKLGFFNRLIVPGLIFQSTMIGGGYATGRELVEFFLQLGPRSGLVAMLVATSIISLVCAVAFEMARRYSLHDYRLFFQKLLGPAWIMFELAFLSLVLLVLSVLGAASNEIVSSRFDVPPITGSIILMASVGMLVFWGSNAIKNFLSAWSILLYCTYAALIVWSLYKFGGEIQHNLVVAEQPALGLDSLRGGFIYAGYNVVTFTSVLFIVRNFANRRDALWAGALCGPLGMIPGLLLLLAMSAHYPEVNDQALPINYLLNQLQAPAALVFFQLVIFGTFIETGAAFLHSVNERISHVFREHRTEMPRTMRPAVSIGFMIIAIFVADAVGIVNLIGQGYTYATYLFLGIVVLPLLTRGVLLIRKREESDVVLTS